MDNETQSAAGHAETAVVKYHAIIERLGYATAWVRELDAKIFCAANGHKFVSYQFWNVISGNLTYRITGVSVPVQSDSFPPYTRSIDAALALVPEGYRWYVADSDRVGGSGVAAVYTTKELLETGCIPRTEAHTPALAVCIAALKARAAVGDPSHASTSKTVA